MSVIDEVRKSTDKPMGSAVFEIGDILGSRGSIKAKKFKKGGTLYARIQKAPPQSAGKLALRSVLLIKEKGIHGTMRCTNVFFNKRTLTLECMV